MYCIVSYCVLCMYLICYLYTIVLTKVTRNKDILQEEMGLDCMYPIRSLEFFKIQIWFRPPSTS